MKARRTWKEQHEHERRIGEGEAGREGGEYVRAIPSSTVRAAPTPPASGTPSWPGAPRGPSTSPLLLSKPWNRPPRLICRWAGACLLRAPAGRFYIARPDRKTEEEDLEEERIGRHVTALPPAMPMRLGVFCCAAPQPHWPVGPPLRDGRSVRPRAPTVQGIRRRTQGTQR